MNIERIVRISLFVALSTVIHFFESMIVIPIPIPGFKLGLANIVGVFVLFYYGYKDYVGVTFFRVLLVAILFSGFGTGFLLSFAGNLFAVLITTLIYFLTRSSIFSASVLGAIFHSIGQVLMYMLISQSVYIITYLPYLAILSMLSGFLLALICRMVLIRMPEYKDTSKIRRKR